MEPNIKDRVTSYEASCDILNRKPLTLEQFAFLPEDQQQSTYSLHRILTGIEAINEGHVFDWNNEDEEKYFPWWDMETYGDDVPGSGFALFGVLYLVTDTYVGARLVCRTAEHARHIATIFFEDYRNWIKK